ncbi:MAG: TatD family hydrolase [Firmicutes bacterium]|nr:TatD family hydrolase [Bacillota bacterium]
MYIDTHAHYDDAQFDADRDRLLQSLAAAGVDAVIDCASDVKSLDRVMDLVEKYPFVYGAVGIHPENVDELDVEDSSMVYNYADQSDKIVAIGEIGLDYHYPNNPDRELQQEWFIEQIELAKELELPVIVHSRDASRDTFEILQDYGRGLCGGVLHSFSGSPELAAEYVKRGFYLGIGGMVTFPNAKKVAATVERIPLEHLLIETDCPYLAPVPNRGHRNDSRNLAYIAARIAGIKGVTVEEVARVTSENARRLFGL